MIHHTLTATEAARSFSDILSQVRYQGRSFEIMRGKEVIAEISPAKSKKGIKVEALNDFFRTLPQLDKEDLKEFSKTLKEIREKSITDKNPWD